MEAWIFRHLRLVGPIRDYHVVLPFGSSVPPRQTDGTRILHEEIIAAYFAESSSEKQSRIMEETKWEAIERRIMTRNSSTIDEMIAQAVFSSLRDSYPAVPEQDLRQVLIECTPRVLQEGWVTDAFSRSWDDTTEPRFGVVNNAESLIKALKMYRKIFIGEMPTCEHEMEDWLNELDNRMREYREQVMDFEQSSDWETYQCFLIIVRSLARDDFAATTGVLDQLYALWTKIVVTYHGISSTENVEMSDTSTTEGGLESLVPSFVALLANDASRAVVNSLASPGFASTDYVTHVIGEDDENEVEVDIEGNEGEGTHLRLLSETIRELCNQLQNLENCNDETNGKPPQRHMDHMQSILNASRHWLETADQKEEKRAEMMVRMLRCTWARLEDQRETKPQVIECIPHLDSGNQVCHTPARQRSRKRRKRSHSSDIFEAVQLGDLDWVRELHSQGIELEQLDEKFGQSPMHEAAVEENVPMMDCLFRRGANPWVRSIKEELPLHIACWYGSETSNAVEWLVNHMGPQHTPSMWKGFHGRTPLHFACFKGNRQVVEYLFRVFRSEDLLHLRDYDGLTAWHYAKLGRHLDLVKWLAEKGADQSDDDTFDPCSIHHACKTGRLGLVIWLKECMPATQNPLEQNADGFTPMELAEMHGHPEVVQFLWEWQEEVKA